MCKKLFFITIIVGLSAAFGCASLRQTNFERKEASNYLYDRPLSEIWPAALKLISKNGYPVPKNFDPNATEITTPFKPMYNRSFRYLLQAEQTNEGLWKIHLLLQDTYVELDVVRSNSEDYDLEWELLKTLEPKTAQKIEEQAKARG